MDETCSVRAVFLWFKLEPLLPVEGFRSKRGRAGLKSILLGPAQLYEALRAQSPSPV